MIKYIVKRIEKVLLLIVRDTTKSTERLERNVNKILITGTPRTGTTFLIQLYHEMGFRTGFKDSYHAMHQDKKHTTHGGLELARDDLYSEHTGEFELVEVIKHPWGRGEKPPWRWSKLTPLTFDHVIITKRNIEESVKSMERRESIKGYGRGIRWDVLSDVRRTHYIQANKRLRTHYPDFIEVDFPRSVKDLEYLHSQLKPTLSSRIDQRTFEQAWHMIARPNYAGRRIW